MTATFHVKLHCEHGECPATYDNGGRYAKEARMVATVDGGWTVTKGRAPNEWHDWCPDHTPRKKATSS